MKKDVFITGLASFFPNSPVSNDEMEEFLGLISGKHSASCVFFSPLFLPTFVASL